MSWVNNWKGKYVTIDPKNPSALGECDDSGLTFNHKDLCKQMQWRGDNLVWTGLMVGRPFLDVPNEQDRPPLTKDDPKPVINPRPPAHYLDPEYPVLDSFSNVVSKLEKESFQNGNPPQDFNSSGIIGSNVAPPHEELINKLNKESFQ